MKTATRARLCICAIALLWATSSSGTIPAPDVLIYGTITAGGETVTAGIMTAVLPGDLDPATTFTWDPEAADPRYILRIPMDALAPASAGRGIEGEIVSLYLDGVAVGAATLGAPGSGRLLDLDADARELDPDADGLTTADELSRGTDPHLADTDGDGIPDGYEVLVGLDPTDGDDADDDPDGNGLSHLDEYLGTVGSGNGDGELSASLDVTQGRPATGIISLSILDEDEYSFTIITAPAHGVATVSGGGVLRYTYYPDMAFVGLDSVTIRITNAAGSTWDVPVDIEVFPDTSAPERPTFESLPSLVDATSPRKLLFEDMTGDGRLDLVVADAAEGRVCTYRGTRTGLTLHETRATGSVVVDMAAVPLDEDEIPDLIVATSIATDMSRQDPESAQDRVAVLLNDGRGGFSQSTSYLSGNVPVCLSVGDVNNDGHWDVAITHIGSEEINLHLGDGTGNLRLSKSVPVGSAPTSALLEDLDGDGRLDLAVTDAATETVSVLLGDGNGNFTASTSTGVGTAPPQVAAGDLDDNGIIDLVVANQGSGDVSVLLGRGDGSFAAAKNYVMGGQPAAIVLADVLGDGWVDLVVLDAQGRTITLMGDGTGGFQAAVLEEMAGTPSALAVGDVDGDHTLDYAIADEEGGEVSIFRVVAPTSAVSGGSGGGEGNGGCFLSSCNQ